MPALLNCINCAFGQDINVVVDYNIQIQILKYFHKSLNLFTIRYILPVVLYKITTQGQE